MEKARRSLGLGDVFVLDLPLRRFMVQRQADPSLFLVSPSAHPAQGSSGARGFLVDELTGGYDAFWGQGLENERY